MGMIEVNWRPSRKDLQVFGIAALLAALIAGALLHYKHGFPAVWTAVIVGLGAAVCISGFVVPALARLVYVAMIGLALPIGLVLSFIVMAVLYYLILTPVGLFFRLIGRDLLDLKFSRRAESYWVKRRAPDVKRYFNQF